MEGKRKINQVESTTQKTQK